MAGFPLVTGSVAPTGSTTTMTGAPMMTGVPPHGTMANAPPVTGGVSPGTVTLKTALTLSTFPSLFRQFRFSSAIMTVIC